MSRRQSRVGVIGMLAVVGILSASCSSGSGPGTTTSTTVATTTTPMTAVPLATTTTAASASAAPCRTSQLSASIPFSQGAAGTAYYSLYFTNNGTAVCTLRGYPGVSLVDSYGKQIGSPAARAPNTSVVSSQVNPGASVTAVIALSDVLNTCSDPVAGSGFRVYPPNQTAALYAPYSGIGICVGKSILTVKWILTVTPVKNLG